MGSTLPAREENVRRLHSTTLYLKQPPELNHSGELQIGVRHNYTLEASRCITWMEAHVDILNYRINIPTDIFFKFISS